MWYLKLFGLRELRGGHGATPRRASQRHQLALLAYLVVARGRPVSRDKLVGLLWPEADAEKARASLSNTLWAIHADLDSKQDSTRSVVASVDEVQLDLTRVISDVEEFEEARESGALDTTASLYDGPFLDGFFLPRNADSAGFDEWLQKTRARFARQWQEAASTLASRAEEGEDWGAAVKWRSKLFEHDQLSTPITLSLMRTLAVTGDRASALRIGLTHVTLLEANEFKSPPEIVAEMERVRAGGSPRSMLSASMQAPASSKTPDRELLAPTTSASVYPPEATQVREAAVRSRPPKAVHRFPLPAVATGALMAVAAMFAASAWREARGRAERRAVGSANGTVASSTSDMTSRGELMKQAIDLIAKGDSLVHQRNFPAAELELRQALSIQTRMRAPAGYEVGSAHYWLGRALFGQHRYADAEQSFVLALPLLMQSVRPDTQDIASTLYFVGRAQFQERKYGAAEQALNRAVALLDASLVPGSNKPNPRDLASAYYYLGRTLAAEQQSELAERALRRALAILTVAAGRSHSDTRAAQHALDDVMASRGAR